MAFVSTFRRILAGSNNNSLSSSSFSWVRHCSALSSPKLFVSGLSRLTTNEKLQDAFAPFGELVDGVSAPNTTGTDIHSAIKGAVLVTIGCFSYACFMILQAVTLRTYQAELSLTAWICLMGTIEGTAVALVMEKGNPGAWAIGWDTELLTAAYSGIVCSAIAYYVGGMVMKTRGPVFVTAFSPLCMIIVAIMSTVIFAEQMYLGRVLGAVVICAGLYLVIWGKGKDIEYPSTPQVGDESTQPKLELSRNVKDSVGHEAITINNQGEQRRTFVETV
ncbi:hypothetical protein F2Q69_00011071 [Brassica cretica]|uniref:WAT1-related protein n=1 Tax=Brassica cretica TaxID=69181 RepID=A0A8S9QWF9_BRACR|nr:hypothetical protein F2Q69_00011071 [Brassica cretica]